MPRLSIKLRSTI